MQTEFTFIVFMSLVLAGGVTSFVTGCVTGSASDPTPPVVVEAPVASPEVVDESVAIKGHWDRITVAVFSHDGSRVVTGSADMTVRLWDANTGIELMRFSGHSQPITSLAISASKGLIASGSSDNSIRVWSAKSGQEMRRLLGHTQFVSVLGFSSDGLKLISGSHDRKLKIWDLDSGQVLRSWSAHQRTVSCLSLSQSMSRILTGSDDKSVAFWNLNDGRAVWRGTGHVSPVISCAATAAADRAISLGSDKKIVVWDTGGGRSIRRFDVPDLGDFSTVAVAPTGAHFGYSFKDDVSNNYGIRIASLASDKPLSFKGHEGPVLAWNFSATVVKTVGADEKIRTWQLTHK